MPADSEAAAAATAVASVAEGATAAAGSAVAAALGGCEALLAVEMMSCVYWAVGQSQPAAEIPLEQQLPEPPAIAAAGAAVEAAAVEAAAAAVDAVAETVDTVAAAVGPARRQAENPVAAAAADYLAPHLEEVQA